MNIQEIIVGTPKLTFRILDKSYTVFALPLTPSQQLLLVDSQYLDKANRLEELEKKGELIDKERVELNKLRVELASKMEEISYNKLKTMLQGKDKEALLEVAKRLNLSSFLVERLEDELKKRGILETLQ